MDTLFVPISAPWLKASESIDFVRAVAPKRAFALHDHLLSPAGFGLVDGLLSRFGGAAYQRLASGKRFPPGLERPRSWRLPDPRRRDHDDSLMIAAILPKAGTSA